MMELKHYSSGFLGSSEVPQTKINKQDESNKTFLTDIYKTLPNKVVQYYTGSVDVDYAYEMFMSKQVNDFSVKENILKISKKVFGTTTFSEWLIKNHQNDEYSFLHMEFVDDVIRYVFLNQEKKVTNIFSWANLLFSKKQTNKMKNISPIQKDFLKNPNFSSIKIDDFILEWLAKENGIGDLIICLAIMFGSRVK
jgi:hypothetical protein